MTPRLWRPDSRRRWEFLKNLASNTGIYTARSRDVPSVADDDQSGVSFASHLRYSGCIERP